MRFELGHVPMPAGYGDGILSLVACKAHLRVEDDSDDDLIAALRDAAIEFVERHCEIKLAPVVGLTWRAESLPDSAGSAIELALRPVSAITAISWYGSDGVAVMGDAADFRCSESGRLQPVVGGSWPSGVAGGVEVTFTAGYPAGDAPPALLSAVKLMLGHLWMNREAVIVGTISGEAPLGVASLCRAFRRVKI